MEQFIVKHQAKIQGVISCFDRILFKRYLPMRHPVWDGFSCLKASCASAEPDRADEQYNARRVGHDGGSTWSDKTVLRIFQTHDKIISGKHIRGILVSCMR